MLSYSFTFITTFIQLRIYIFNIFTFSIQFNCGKNCIKPKIVNETMHNRARITIFVTIRYGGNSSPCTKNHNMWTSIFDFKNFSFCHNLFSIIISPAPSRS